MLRWRYTRESESQPAGNVYGLSKWIALGSSLERRHLVGGSRASCPLATASGSVPLDTNAGLGARIFRAISGPALVVIRKGGNYRTVGPSSQNIYFGDWSANVLACTAAEVLAYFPTSRALASGTLALQSHGPYSCASESIGLSNPHARMSTL